MTGKEGVRAKIAAGPHKPYLDAWIQRVEKEEEERLRAREVAFEEARAAARLLVEHFGADRVYLFGSLLFPGVFRETSDIDLACEGVPPGQFIRASREAAKVTRFPLDLVPLEGCIASLREAILREGVLLAAKYKDAENGGLPITGGPREGVDDDGNT